MEMIDLRSDTVTRPSKAMRQAIANAEVGDDVFGEDPSVNRLQEAMATMLGKEAGLFVTSGTMGNQLAVRAQTHHGEEIVVEEHAHVFNAEAGALGALAGVQARLLHGQRGTITRDQIAQVVRPKNVHYGRTALIAVENTHNRANGAIFPIDVLADIRAFALERGIRVHMDGARLFNACVASGRPAREYARHVDTVSICLSKGLGAPVGSVLVGDREMIERAAYYRKMYGGGMRQAGILAAAGLYALEHNIDRLADDHANARRLAEGLAASPAVDLNVEEIQTNIVYFGLRRGLSAPDVITRLREHSVLMLATGPRTIRAVTHLDVSRAQIDRAVDVCQSVLARENQAG
ncbi:MAG: low-specificity L-threonine aldolase [Candidatus Latescibacteria bacterium]|nr:low-specificity L-threonine aldolase [Candidatus Latescibacterota bacterium]